MKIIISIFVALFWLCSIQTASAQKKTKGFKPKKKAIIVSCGICNEKAILLPKPEYPKAGIAVHASGKVSVEILIDENGNVLSAKAISGHPLLRVAAVNSALKAKFEPLILSGKPVRVRGIIVYGFVFNEINHLRVNSSVIRPTG